MKNKEYRIPDLLWLILGNVPVLAMAMISNMLITALLPMAETIALARFVDTVTAIWSGDAEHSAISESILFVIGCVFISKLLPILMDICILAGRKRLRCMLESACIQKWTRLEYAHIEDTETQELIYRTTEDPTEKILNGFQNVLQIFRIVITTISLLGLIFAYSWMMAILILGISIPFALVALRAGKENYNLWMDSEILARRFGYLADVLTKREYVMERSLFSYSSALINRYEAIHDEVYQIEKKNEIRTFFNLKKGSVITLIAAVIIIGLLLKPLGDGILSVGLLISLTNAILNLVETMSWQLSDAMFEFARTREYLKDLSAFLQLSEKEAADTEKSSEAFVLQSLEFRDVSFAYPGSNVKILDHCSFTLQQGKSYAFVGENGAGKSTIVKLLTGLYDNYEGTILINGKELRSYSYDQIKQWISVVFQDYAKYSLSVRENVQLGDLRTADRERIEKALARIGFSEVLNKLPNGMETALGKLQEDSTDLSGGQWQRLAIARMLYADAPINILDEPTAALDPVQESRLYELFRDIRKDQFAIYITHRLGAARMSDEILVIDQGRIAERGKHEHLMQIPDGIYRTMFEAQSSWYL